MRIEIAHSGDVQVSRELLRFSDRAMKAKPAFRSIASLLRSAEREQFVTQGRFASDGWEKLSPATIAAKARDPLAKYKRAILRRTGAMFAAWTKRSDPQHIEEISDDELRFGASDPKSKFHQRGTVNMPRRRVLEIRGRDRNEIVKRLQRWITTGTVTP